MNKHVSALPLLATAALLAIGCGLVPVFSPATSTPTASSTHTPTAPSPTPTIAPTPTPPGYVGAEQMARTLNEQEIPGFDRPDRMARIGRISPPVQRTVSLPLIGYAIGQVEDFTFVDWMDNSRRTVSAELRYITDHAYTWVEVGTYVDQAALIRAAERFENEIYPTVRHYFGEEWSPGVDNDPHISMLHMSGLGNSLALFANMDEYTAQIWWDSNQHEMFYVNLDMVNIGDDLHLAILGHEFEHMIQWNNPGNEAHALDEGLAQLAQTLLGYEDTLFTHHDFLANPRTSLNSWVEGRSDESRYYGANYLFSLYLWEQFGDDFIRTLARHPEEGLKSVNASLAEHGHDLTVDDVFADWIVANYLADDGGRYGYTHEQLAPICPQRIYTTPVQESRALPQYAAEYLQIEGQGNMRIDFEGATEVALIPTSPHSGHSFWWSNRGDDAEMSLTRAFDLSGLQGATLQFWMWFDIQTTGEEFACLAISTNGGITWEYPETDNAPATFFYPCYVGISGDGDSAEWVFEEFDLSSYAGQEIMIRFEYVTDTWHNRPGFAVDDIAIPELGYRDDVESGEAGWEAAGFVRTSNVVPQKWTLQLLNWDQQTPIIQPVYVNEDGAAHVDVMLPFVDSKAVLAVGAMAPSTEQEARYELRISGDLSAEPGAETVGPDVLLFDNFNNPCSGWGTYNEPNQAHGYADGFHYLEVRAPYAGTWALPGVNLPDVQIDVETIQQIPAVDNSWGVICRMVDEYNYYSFEISNYGSYSIYARLNGEHVFLVEWSFSETINTGEGASNQITATCDGDLLSLSVNGQLLAQVRDNALQRGDIGMIALTNSQPGARVLFDNLVVRRP